MLMPETFNVGCSANSIPSWLVFGAATSTPIMGPCVLSLKHLKVPPLIPMHPSCSNCVHVCNTCEYYFLQALVETTIPQLFCSIAEVHSKSWTESKVLVCEGGIDHFIPSCPPKKWVNFIIRSYVIFCYFSHLCLQHFHACSPITSIRSILCHGQ